MMALQGTSNPTIVDLGNQVMANRYYDKASIGTNAGPKTAGRVVEGVAAWFYPGTNKQNNELAFQGFAVVPITWDVVMKGRIVVLGDVFAAEAGYAPDTSHNCIFQLGNAATLAVRALYDGYLVGDEIRFSIENFSNFNTSGIAIGSFPHCKLLFKDEQDGGGSWTKTTADKMYHENLKFCGRSQRTWYTLTILNLAVGSEQFRISSHGDDATAKHGVSSVSLAAHDAAHDGLHKVPAALDAPTVMTHEMLYHHHMVHFATTADRAFTIPIGLFEGIGERHDFVIMNTGAAFDVDITAGSADVILAGPIVVTGNATFGTSVTCHMRTDVVAGVKKLYVYTL